MADFDPDAFLAGGTAVAEPAFDPDAFLNNEAPFDPDAFLADSAPQAQAAPTASSPLVPAPVGSVGDAALPGQPGDAVNEFLNSSALPSADMGEFLQPAVDPSALQPSAQGGQDIPIEQLGFGSQAKVERARTAGYEIPSMTDSAMTPAAEIIPRMKPAEAGPLLRLADPSGISNLLPTEASNRVAAIGENIVADTVNFFTSPVGVATLGIGALPSVLQKTVAGVFAAHAAKEAPETVRAIVEAKTPEERDQAIVAAAESAMVLAGGAKHATGRSPMPAAERLASMERAKAVVADAKVLAETGSPLTAAETLKQGASNETQPSSPTIRSETADNPNAQLRAGEDPGAVPATAGARTDRPGATSREDALATEASEARAPELTERTPAPGEAAKPTPPVVEQSPALAEGAAAAAPESISKNAAAQSEPTTTPQTATAKPAGETSPTVRPVEAAAPSRVVELLPEQAEVAAPKLDVRRSPFALGVSPDLKAVNWLAANTKRLFTATGDLPKQTFERWIERNGFVKAESRQTAYATRDLYNALKKEFNISTTEQLTKGFEKVPREFVGKMNQALLGEVDMNTLPESVRAPLQAMRQHIDALSFKMLEEGVIPESLQAKVADNLGVYMTRSYRIFDDPKWAESIPQDVRNRARDFILSNLKKENPSAGPVEAKAVMDAMLQDWKDQGSGALVKTGGKVGSKDLTSLIARKDIPKVIREVMGEYQDPLISYTRSITKAANLLGSHRFLNQVRSEGLGKFLFEDGKQPSTHSALIAAEGSDVMAPLNGLRTTPEIATAFREFGKSDPIKNGIAQAYFTLSGIAKMAKTVGSVMTQARNIIGQTYFFLANGHFDMTKAAPAVRAVMADLGARDTPTGRAAYQRYLRLGIVDQSAKASELRDVIRDAGLSDPGVNLTEPGNVLLRTTKKLTLDAATKAYQISDDLGKIIGFENELTRQREIHPEWSQTTLEAAAAERIRNTYPTYAMASKAIQTARRAPLGPFMIFASESFRTAYHNLRYAIEDIQSSNPAQRKAGAQRVAGLLAVAGSGYALSKISQALIGMNAQDEDDARRFMAPWDKDSQIMYTGKDDNGAARFINLSYANPYSYMTDPVMAVAGGLRSEEELQAIMLRSLGKLAQPFTSEDIVAGSLISLARNKTPTGARVFNPGDTPGKQFEDKLAFMAKTFEPGTLTRVKGKIIPAIKGETDKTGRVPELTNEIVSELTGFKSQILDFQQAVGFKARAFKAMDDDADSIFRDVAGRRGTVQPDEIVDAYSRAARSKFAAWKEMHGDIQAAERRGVSRDAIQTALKARGVSQKEASAIMDGKFIPPQVSPALQKQMRDAKRTLPPAAEQEMKRAAGLVLSGSFEPAE